MRKWYRNWVLPSELRILNIWWVYRMQNWLLSHRRRLRRVLFSVRWVLWLIGKSVSELYSRRLLLVETGHLLQQLCRALSNIWRCLAMPGVHTHLPRVCRLQGLLRWIRSLCQVAMREFTVLRRRMCWLQRAVWLMHEAWMFAVRRVRAYEAKHRMQMQRLLCSCWPWLHSSRVQR